MPSRAKPVFLELVSGAFGWAWLIAGGFAIYYFVMAIGFEGSWVPFIIALVISGIAKWLLRGFESNKRRVASEADLVAKDMPPQDAGKAQAQAHTDQSAPEVSVAATETVSMTEENRRKAEERSRIISDYGEFIERNPTAAEIWDVKLLPHDKETIFSAICLEIVREQDEGRLEALKASALFLADFQEGVGDKPLSPVGVDLPPADPASMSDDDLRALAEKIAGSSDRERYEAFQPLVQENEEKILAKVAAAERMRREMPEDKKREILG